MPDNPNRRDWDPSGYQGVERRQNERRRHVRFPFTASVEAVEPQSSAKINGRTSDLSSGGCYVDTISPFSVGTNIKLCLTKEGLSFNADATVVLSQVGMGMGVAFSSANPQQIRTLQKWLNDLEGKSPPEADEPDPSHNEFGPRNLTSQQDQQGYVLHELLVTLIRKGILSDDEGKAILRKLLR